MPQDDPRLISLLRGQPIVVPRRPRLRCWCWTVVDWLLAGVGILVVAAIWAVILMGLGLWP